MLSKKIQELLNRQVELEAASSQYYLAMASWAQVKGYNGVSKFLYKHSDEERMHMLKLVHFVNERGGHGLVPALKAPTANFKNIQEIFEMILKHEVHVSTEINKLVDRCLA